MVTFHEVDGKQNVRAMREGGGYLSRKVNITSKVFVLEPLEGKGTGGPGLLEGRCSGVGWDHRGQFVKHRKEGVVGLVLGSGVEDEAQWLLGMVPRRSILGNCA